ncbi:MAG TPA: carboxypeptidase regulatory-like domain-containing protein, partial [Vicinamibacterales bacterium]|nr:carboxypeptidase regulatory-like domain-containing protein [Vicinamibacterales bacterium]
MLSRSTALFVVAAAVALSAQSTTPGQTTPPRDNTAQSAAQQAPPTSKISGRVVAADTARPVSRARVLLSGSLGGGKSTITDATGAYELTEIPAGRFTLQV